MNYEELNRNEQLALFYLLNPLPNEEYSLHKTKKRAINQNTETQSARLSHFKTSSVVLSQTYRDLHKEKEIQNKRELSLSHSKLVGRNSYLKTSPDQKVGDFSTNVIDFHQSTPPLIKIQGNNYVTDYSQPQNDFTRSFVSDFGEEISLLKHLGGKSQIVRTSPAPKKSKTLTADQTEHFLKIFSPSKKVNFKSNDPVYSRFLKMMDTYSDSNKKIFERVFVEKEKKIPKAEESELTFNMIERELKEKINELSDDIRLKDRHILKLSDNRIQFQELRESIELKSMIWQQFLYFNKLKFMIFEILRKVYFISDSNLQKCYVQKEEIANLISSVNILKRSKAKSQTKSSSLNKLIKIVKGEFIKQAALIIEENWKLINLESETRAVSKEIANEMSISEELAKQVVPHDFRLSERFMLLSQSELITEEKEVLLHETLQKKAQIPKLKQNHEFEQLELESQIEESNKEISQLTLRDTVFEEGIRELRLTNRSKLKEVADIKESLEKFYEMKEKQRQEIEKISNSLQRRGTVQE